MTSSKDTLKGCPTSIDHFSLKPQRSQHLDPQPIRSTLVSMIASNKGKMVMKATLVKLMKRVQQTQTTIRLHKVSLLIWLC